MHRSILGVTVGLLLGIPGAILAHKSPEFPTTSEMDSPHSLIGWEIYIHLGGGRTVQCSSPLVWEASKAIECDGELR